MPAIDALHSRSIVLDDLEHSGVMRTMLEAFITTTKDETERYGAPIFKRGARGDDIRDYLMRTLSVSEAFYVSGDMLLLATAGAEMLPDDVTVQDHDVVAPVGWMHFQEPVTVTDVRGKLLCFNAVSWAVGMAGDKPGVAVMWWSNKYDPVDSVNVTSRLRYPKQWSSVPLYTFAHVTSLQFDRPLPRTVSLSGPGGAVIPPDFPVQVDTSQGRVTWTLPSGVLSDTPEYGKTFVPFDQSDYTPTDMSAPDLRVLTVIWRLMRQTITDVSDSTERIPAYLRKAIARQNTTDRVSVIELRKHAKHREQGREIEWSHRFLRRGHWRHQWFGSEAKNNRRQEWIWVHPSIVNAGRDDLPLLVRDHVSALVR